MAEAPIMPFATDAFVADTTALDDAETGAYMLLLVALWRSETGTLPFDHKTMARHARCRADDWPARWDAIKGFFIIENGTIRQGRVTRDRLMVRARIEKARENGRKGGRPKPMELQEDKPTGSIPVKQNGTQDKAGLEKLSISISKTISRKKEVTPFIPQGEKPSKGTKLPDNFPDEWCMARAIDYWATHHRDDIDVADQATQFRAHHEARGTTSKKWAASWQTWYMNALKFSRPAVKAKMGFGDIFDDLRSRGVME